MTCMISSQIYMVIKIILISKNLDLIVKQLSLFDKKQKETILKKINQNRFLLREMLYIYCKKPIKTHLKFSNREGIKQPNFLQTVLLSSKQYNFISNLY